MNDLWKNWLLDVSLSEPCFVPYEDDGSVVTGMMVISNECPGKFIGVFHQDGQEAVEQWCKENPDWRTRFKEKTP